MNLVAAYVIDDIKDKVNDFLIKEIQRWNIDHPDLKKSLVKIEENIESKYSSFSFTNINFTIENPLPIESVLYNYFSRGIPTKCSLKVEAYLLNKYSGYSEIQIKRDLREFIFSNQGTEVYLEYFKLMKLIELPILAGQLHKAFTAACISSQKDKINIYTDIIDSELLKIVVQEFNEIVKAFSDLCCEPYVKHIVISDIRNSDFSFTKENHSFDSEFLEVESIKTNTNKFLYNKSVQYKDYGVQEEDINDNNEVVSYFNILDSEMHAGLLYILNQTFRFKGFKAGQQAIIRRILLRKDVIGLLPTGGGKSLCYQLCGLLQPGLTIIVDPINSLMKDQELKLKEFGVNQAVFINSMLSSDERDKRLENLSDFKYLFLFISPERFHIPKYRSALLSAKQNGTSFHQVVIDEAHVVSEWGHDFRPSYLKLAFSINKLLADSPAVRPSFVGLTATASFDVLADVQRELSVDDATSLDNDAIATLPPEAINREELSFNIIPINYWQSGYENMQFFHREFEISNSKYSKLNSILSHESAMHNLFNVTEGSYENGMIIFCPTKSDKLPSGVNYMYDKFIQRYNETSIVRYHGQGNDIVHGNPEVDNAANEATNNQELFLKNKAAVMICTKAFGMGIDKPNIRSTVHYSMPASVEGFYQEAGRAGRDGQRAYCYLLYDYHDVQTNYDFLRNSFNNERKERTISDELCHQIKFEKGFKRRVLSKLISEHASLEVNLGQITDTGWINLYGKFHKNPENKIKYGGLNVSTQYFSSKFHTNTNEEEIIKVRQSLSVILDKYINSRNLSLETYLGSELDDGIIPVMLTLGDNASASIIIGFRNDYITKMAEVLEKEVSIGKHQTGYFTFLNWERLLHRAYEFSADDNDFIERLTHYTGTYFSDGLIALNNENLVTRIRNSFYHIRSTSDTEKAIYRLKQLGVIDDYVLDYKSMHFDIQFSNMDINKYKNNLNNYFRRYVAQKPASNLVKNAENKIIEDNYFLPYRDAMIEFVHTEIKAKRRKAIDYMYDLCNKYQEQGEENFKNDVKYYFASKYSASQYLPFDTEDGKKSSSKIVLKYLDYINNPPNGMGGPINNFEHLKGACNRYLISQGINENPSILILNATSTIAIDSSRSTDLVNYIQSNRFLRAEKQLIKGYRLLIKDGERVAVLQELLNANISLLEDFNISLSDILGQMKLSITNLLLINKAKNIRQKLTKI